MATLFKKPCQLTGTAQLYDIYKKRKTALLGGLPSGVQSPSFPHRQIKPDATLTDAKVCKGRYRDPFLIPRMQVAQRADVSPPMVA